MAWIVLISFVLYYSFLTIAYNINWKNPLIFYRWNLKFAPNSYKLHYLLGNYYLDMGNIDLAFNEYEKALEFDNNFMFSKINVKYYEDAYKGNNLIFAKLNHNLGVILNKRNYIQEAQESFKKAIELNPGLVESYNDLGLLYIKNNELDKAEEILNAGLEANPKFEKIYYNLGVIYVQKNDRTKALKYWNKALELNLDYVAAREGVKRLNEQD